MIAPYLTDINRQIVALVGSGTVLSAFVKNVGALAMFMPIAAVAKKEPRGVSARIHLGFSLRFGDQQRQYPS